MYYTDWCQLLLLKETQNYCQLKLSHTLHLAADFEARWTTKQWWKRSITPKSFVKEPKRSQKGTFQNYPCTSELRTDLLWSGLGWRVLHVVDVFWSSRMRQESSEMSNEQHATASTASFQRIAGHRRQPPWQQHITAQSLLTVTYSVSSEWVSRFLTAHQHNEAIQCHSRRFMLEIQDRRQMKNTDNTEPKHKPEKANNAQHS